MAYRCTIHVSNFDKYHTKAVGHKTKGFITEISMLHRSAFKSMSSGAKLLWFYVLAEACSSIRRECELDARTMAPLVHLNHRRVAEAVHELASLQWIQILNESDPLGNRREGKGNEEKGIPPAPTGGDPLPSVELQPDLPLPPDPEPSMHRIAVLWNENCGKLPMVREMNKVRLRRCQENNHRSDDEIRKAIKALTSSEFHSGNNDRGWKADFEYFIRPGIIAKALEGSFRGKGPEGNGLYDTRGVALR